MAKIKNVFFFRHLFDGTGTELEGTTLVDMTSILASNESFCKQLSDLLLSNKISTTGNSDDIIPYIKQNGLILMLGKRPINIIVILNKANLHNSEYYLNSIKNGVIVRRFDGVGTCLGRVSLSVENTPRTGFIHAFFPNSPFLPP